MEDYLAGKIGNDRPGSVRGDGGNRAQRVAEPGRGRLLVVAVKKMDEGAMLVDVRKRMDERALPRREQRDNKKQACEEARHYEATCWARRR